MTPMQFLVLVLLITAAAVLVQRILRHRHVAVLRALADEWQMHYSDSDRFRLAPRVAQRLPVPGAASVRVVDLLYGIDRDRYRYLFATEYTIGVLRSKTGVRRVATFSEPRDPASQTAPDQLVFAPDDLPLIDQYRYLRKLSPASA